MKRYAPAVKRSGCSLKQYALLNVVAVALLIAWWLQGSLRWLFEHDVSYCSWLIVAVTVYGVVQIARGKFKTGEKLADDAVKLGLLGTVMGLIAGLWNVDPTQVADLGSVMSWVGSMLLGMATALFTTGVGIVSNMWLDKMIGLRQ